MNVKHNSMWERDLRRKKNLIRVEYIFFRDSAVMLK